MCFSISFPFHRLLCFVAIFTVFPNVSEVGLIYLNDYGRALKLYSHKEVESPRKAADLTDHKSICCPCSFGENATLHSFMAKIRLRSQANQVLLFE